MTEQSPWKSAGFDWSNTGNRRRQLRIGLEMTPAERLAWLEAMLDELLPLVGRARRKHQGQGEVAPLICRPVNPAS